MVINKFLDIPDFLGKFDIGHLQSYEVKEILAILPSLKNPRWLIPFKNKELFISSLALYQPSLKRVKILKKLTVLAAKSGLSNLAIRDRVYFHRNDDFIKKIFGRNDLYYAIFTGTEGTHRKVTVQVMDGKGTILGYIKTSGNEDVDELLRNEAEILGDLSRLELKSGLFPKIIYRGEIKGTNVLILDTLKSVNSRSSSKLSDKHVDFLSELFQKTARILKYKESGFAMGLQQRLRDLENKTLEIGKLKDTYEKALDFVERNMGDEEMPFGLCHRDFTPWNTFFHNGLLYVFDWEYAKRDYPPLLDIFHFIIQDGILVRHLKPEGLLKRILKNGKWLSTYSSLVGIKESLVMPLLICYLLDISLLYIEREKGEIGGIIKGTVETWGGMMDLVIGDG